MNSRRSLCLFIILGIATLFAATFSSAASPGVPSLGSNSQDYVDYSVTSLPLWFRTAVISAMDNTPVDNPITNDGAELGRVLFYDARLSHNDGTSCASCHIQENSFTDPNKLSEGFEGGLTGRHSMSLANAKFYDSGKFFWDERADTLEDQVLMPIQDSVEMGSDLSQLTSELQATDYYPVLFERAFGDSQVTSERMGAAMAQFVRSMTSYQSEFDQALAAGTPGPGGRTPDFAAVASIEDPVAASNGHATFAQNCAGCHQTQAQVGDGAKNIGLDATNTDEGAGNGTFKVPSLRNIAERGGYMHDGRFTTLEEVIEFYSNGIQDNPNLTRPLQPGGLGFSESEKSDLLAFLETLSDDSFLTSELFSNPFVTLDGDYNGDGIVDMDDYNSWRDSYGMTVEDISGPLFADGNLDGVVDAADYSLWRDNLGASWNTSGIGFSPINSIANATAIPEPGALRLMLIVLVSAFAGCHSRSCQKTTY